MSKFWTPKQRSNSHSRLVSAEDIPEETQEAQEETNEPIEPGSVCKTQVDSEAEEITPRNLSPEFDALALGSGESTPKTSTAEQDEYLAWTLGGKLQMTPSPMGPPPYATSPLDLSPLSKEIQELEWLVRFSLTRVMIKIYIYICLSGWW